MTDDVMRPATDEDVNRVLALTKVVATLGTLDKTVRAYHKWLDRQDPDAQGAALARFDEQRADWMYEIAGVAITLADARKELHWHA